MKEVGKGMDGLAHIASSVLTQTRAKAQDVAEFKTTSRGGGVTMQAPHCAMVCIHACIVSEESAEK